MDENEKKVIQFDKNGRHHSETSTGQINDKVASPDESFSLTELLDNIPDSVRPHLQTLEPYSVLLLKWLIERNSWYDSFVQSLRDLLRKDPIENLKNQLKNSYGTFKNETLSGKLLNSYRRSASIGDFLRINTARLLAGVERSLRPPSERNDNQPGSRKDEANLALLENQHRIKNHLQQIISLIKLKRRNSNNNAGSILDQTVELLENFIQLNKKLDSGKNANGNCADMGTHIRENVESLSSSFSQKPLNTHFDITADPIETSRDKIVPIGLIVNELSMNSLQHGYQPNETAKLSISLTENAGEVQLEIHDDGKGLPDTFDWEETYGLNLVKKLAEKQLNGTLELTERENGTGWRISFPLSDFASSTNGSG